MVYLSVPKCSQNGTAIMAPSGVNGHPPKSHSSQLYMPLGSLYESHSSVLPEKSGSKYSDPCASLCDRIMYVIRSRKRLNVPYPNWLNGRTTFTFLLRMPYLYCGLGILSVRYVLVVSRKPHSIVEKWVWSD